MMISVIVRKTIELINVILVFRQPCLVHSAAVKLHDKLHFTGFNGLVTIFIRILFALGNGVFYKL